MGGILREITEIFTRKRKNAKEMSEEKVTHIRL